MLVWINGPFGVGKTTTAALLHKRLAGSVIVDPEEVGFMLRNSLGDHPRQQRDFQDYPMWRTLVTATCSEIDQYVGEGPVIVPMTLLHREYAEEIFEGLLKANIEVHHFLLHAESNTIRTRIDNSTEFSKDEKLCEKVRAFRQRKLTDYEDAYGTWLSAETEVIDTTLITPEQVTDQAAALLARHRRLQTSMVYRNEQESSNL